jgi:hypothetical protein
MTYLAGFKIVASVVVSGPDALAKARKFAEIYWQRVGQRGLDESRTDLLGYSACWGDSAAPPVEPNEVILRLSARAADAKPLQRMARELAGIALAGPAGICGAGGRPEVTPAVGYWPALIPRRLVTARTFFQGESISLPCDFGPASPIEVPSDAEPPRSRGIGRRVRVPLKRVAYSRSGDKGDTCNVGIAALAPELYPELVREVTAERVQEFFRSNVRGPVLRYRLDNLAAMNFVMRSALGGGGTVSLLLDNQGKTMAQGLLNMEIDVAEDLLPKGR